MEYDRRDGGIAFGRWAGALLAGALAGVVVAVTLPARAAAQSSTLRVVASDSTPIAFAWINIAGRDPAVADDHGLMDLGTARNKTLSVEVRRIGYIPWTGKLELPKKPGTLTVVLDPRVANAANRSPVTGLVSAGFYDRWLQKERGGMRYVTFIGPEMIEKRQAPTTMDLLDRVWGVRLVRDSKGARAATGTGPRPAPGMGQGGGGRHGGGKDDDSFGRRPGTECYLTVLIDGGPVCPNVGCSYPFVGDPPGSTRDDHTVDLDKLLTPSQIAGIEVYPTKDVMPPDVRKEYNGCGVIMVWTGGRQ